MQDLAPAGPSRPFPQNLLPMVRSALFFVPFFLFVYLWISPTLIYHRHEGYLTAYVYVPGMNIFGDMPAFPGKAAEFLTACLNHYFYYSSAAAVIITAVAWLLCLLTEKLVTATGTGRLKPLRFVPPILLLVQYARYYHHLGGSVAMVIGLGLAYLYIRVPLHSRGLRFTLFLLLSVAVYWSATVSYPAFVLFCAGSEILNRQRLSAGLLYLVAGLLVAPLVGVLVLNTGLAGAYYYALPHHPMSDRYGITLAFGLYLFFPIAGSVCVCDRFFARKRRRSGGKQGNESKFKRRLQTLAPVIIASLVVLLTRDCITRRRLRIDYFSQHKMWHRLLREVRELSAAGRADVFVSHDVNRALYHTGRLLDDMFSYPQHQSPLLLPPDVSVGSRRTIRTWVKIADAFYEMGLICKAENAVSEALAGLNYYPAGLKRLALINIVKGRPDTARVALHALRRDFLYRRWAEDYLRQLEADPLMSANEEIRRMRSLILVEDSVDKVITPGDLLERNPKNRMAWEYVMAYLLTSGQVGPAATNVPRFMDSVGLPEGRIPRHCEEAILLYTSLTGRQVDLRGRRMNPKTIRRFEDLANRARAGTPVEDFGDTYYYYSQRFTQ